MLRIKRSSFWYEPWECYQEATKYNGVLTPLTSKQYDHAHLNGNLIVVVDDADNGLMPLRGWALYELIGDNTAWLTHIARFQNAQEPGIGGMLLDGLFAETARKGCDTVALGVHAQNTHAQKFYVKHGFEQIGVTYSSGLWLLFGRGPSLGVIRERMQSAEIQSGSDRAD